MKKITSYLILCLILVISMTSSIFATSNENIKLDGSQNLLDGGYIIVNEDGSIAPQPRFDINDGTVTLSGGQSIYFSTSCWFDGGKMTFSVSASSGDVGYLNPLIWSPSYSESEFENFNYVNGTWYGRIVVDMENRYVVAPYKYYKYGLTNNGPASITVDSFTGIDD